MTEQPVPRRRRGVDGPIAAFLVAGPAAAVVFELWVLFHVGGDRATRAVDDLALVAGATLATALTLRRARRERHSRLGWGFLTAVCAGIAGGQAIYAFYELVLGVPAPFPSLADLSYVIGTTLQVPAVLLLAGRALRSSRLRLLMDGGIVALAVLLVSWLTVLQAVWHAGATDWFSFSIALYYPIGNVVTVVIVLSTLSNARRLNPALVVVGIGMLCLAVTLSAYAYLTAVGAYNGPNPIDVGWLTAYLVLGLASFTGVEHRANSRDARLARWQIALPYVPLVGAALLTLSRFAGSVPLDSFSVAMVAMLVVLVIGRQLVALVEAQSLAAQLALTAAEREILIEQAPVGICRLDEAEHLLATNLTFRSMLGYSWDDLAGRSFIGLVHPEDRARIADAYVALEDGRLEHLETESRLVRRDGTSLWASQLAAVVRDAGGRLESIITIVENVTERRQQTERAARIQRQLLPTVVPHIPGYELAGACVAAQDVAGDFYDWMAVADGRIDLTVADVMGKGVGAGLVMATLRAGLRAAPRDLGPAARAMLAAESVVGLDSGLFVTMFHARLEPASGELRYVDAGQGHSVIRRGDGTLATVRQRSLPLGVLEDEMFHDSVALLEPGDALIVYSDGLVEREDGNLQLADLLSWVDGSESATDLAVRLLERSRGPLADDVTVLVLRRLPQRATFTEVPAPPVGRPLRSGVRRAAREREAGS